MLFFSGFFSDSASSLKQHPQDHILLYMNTFFILQANHSLFLLLITDNKYWYQFYSRGFYLTRNQIQNLPHLRQVRLHGSTFWFV
jgi:hypothetical protein